MFSFPEGVFCHDYSDVQVFHLHEFYKSFQVGICRVLSVFNF